MKEIKGFFEEYKWLSNFYEIPVEWDGRMYPSTEAAYQSAKTLNRNKRLEFTEMTAGQSKRAGRKLSLRYDWEEVKEIVMYEVCMDKFTRHEELKQKLLSTGDAYLEETNHWGDTYWGVCEGKGTNRLGHILMKIREEIKNGRS
jgi:ribA/ribD-fused uncharacterized protein